VNPVYLLMEAGAAAFFVVAGWLALRRGLLPLLELLSAAVFGLLLEQANQALFETYEYSRQFVLAVDRAPVVIGLTWALIIAGAMRISDALGVRRRYAPFVDSMLAIMLDLAFDAVAIRMGLWTWRDISLADGWFGVPAGNFYAWLFVTFAFSLFTRWLREAAETRPALTWLQLLVPIPSFVLVFFAIMSFSILAPAHERSPGGGMPVFWIALAIFAAISAWAIWGRDRATPDGDAVAILDLRLAFATRLAIHLWFLGALVVIGVAVETPVLLLVALLMLALELPLTLLAHRRHAVALRA